MTDFASNIRYIQRDNLIINKDFTYFLHVHNLDSFDSIWNNKNGQIIKNIKSRSVIRLSLSNDLSENIVYIKKHKLKFIGLHGLIKRCRGKQWISQGPLEFKNICDFRDNGLQTVIPIMAGENIYRIFWSQSFLVTKDFFPYKTLESILENNPDIFNDCIGKHKKDTLIKEISSFARRMHAKGFHHRDFNATHILIHYTDNTKPALAVFDLQRIEKNILFRIRWKIKCIARLIYSISNAVFDENDRLNFVLHYNQTNKTRFKDRITYMFVKRKLQKIKKHTDKKYTNK